jgi:thymidylate kinase
MIVALEGLSGCGKTTVARELAPRLDAQLLPTVPIAYSEARRLLDTSDNVDARFCLFMSAMLFTSREIERTRMTGRNAVLESYLFRTIAFHRGMGSVVDISLPPHVAMPDLTVLLTCDERERQVRLALRGDRKHDWDRLAEDCRNAILSQYDAFPMLRVDTTGLTPSQTAQQIAGLCNSVGYQP